MSEIQDYAYKFGCGRYIQEENAVKRLGDEVLRFGKKPYIMGGPTALKLARDKITASLNEKNIPHEFSVYSGHCCYKSADEEVNKAKLFGCDMIIGVGGGRIMDFSKLCACKMDVPVITVPTSSATCAAFTTLSVIYDENGKTIGNFYHRKETACVIVDYDFMINQPVRLAVSGILDAFAKYIEIKNGYPTANAENFNYDLVAAYVLAEHTYKTLFKDLNRVSDDIKNHRLTDAVKTALFLAIPVTGIISGISKGFGQSALAHEFYYCIRTNFTKEALSYLHGEVVAIGLLMQHYYNQTPDEVEILRDLMKRWGMPVSLKEIGIEPSEKNRSIIYGSMIKSPFVTNDPTHEKRFYDSLLQI